MPRLLAVAVAYLIVVPATAWVLLGVGPKRRELLNVSYDPTRELWRDLNAAFLEANADSDERLVFRQSHGGSASQARAVIDGLSADVLTLALWPDVDAVRRAGLVADGWEGRLPNGSVPYYSTIVFVVRKQNPKRIRDWPDLIRPGVSVITPNPKTSGNGKLSFLAAWGAVREAGSSDADAEAFVTELYRHTPVLDTGARGSAMTFAQKRIGDVHLTWENEAYLEVQESNGELEIVYPPRSIKAEMPVTVVDANVDRKGTRAVAERYLEFLFTDAGQRVIARHHFRPYRDEFSTLPDVKLFTLSAIAADWDEAQRRFFAEGGAFDRIYQPGK
jgi:sulfate/thiosulfate transport system substrate-binding protein